MFRAVSPHGAGHLAARRQTRARHLKTQGITIIGALRSDLCKWE
jgi:hypothetical protein